MAFLRSYVGFLEFFSYFSWLLWLCTMEIEILRVCGVYLQVCVCGTGGRRRERGKKREGEGMHGESSLFLHHVAKRLWWLQKPEGPQNPPQSGVLEEIINWLELVCEVKPIHYLGPEWILTSEFMNPKCVVHALCFSVWQKNNQKEMGKKVLNYSHLWVALG